MDIKETIISSFFFHLILLMLLLTIANYTAGLSANSRNMITLDLSNPVVKEQTEPLPDPANRSSEDLSALPEDKPDGKMSLSDKPVAGKPKEEAPQPVKKPETAPVKTETPEPSPIRTEGFSSPEAYYQFILLHKKIFRENAGGRVNQLLGEAFKTNKRVFYGGTAVVNLTFGPAGKVTGVIVDSQSPGLKSFLDEIVWDSIPAPSAYSLGNSRVQIEFSVGEGYMNFNINPL